MFPKIDENIQKRYETVESHIPEEEKYIPIICGYKGRACRQMKKDEGANRMLCTGCSLALYAENRRINRR